MWGSDQQPLRGLPGPQTILKTLAGSLGLSSLSKPETPPLETASTCSRSDLSCYTKYNGQNTCCFNYPGGQFLLTQLWDFDPALGPDDSWTIHGLW
jgi:ribonuclease T2